MQAKSLCITPVNLQTSCGVNYSISTRIFVLNKKTSLTLLQPRKIGIYNSCTNVVLVLLFVHSSALYISEDVSQVARVGSRVDRE